MDHHRATADTFRYEGYELDHVQSQVTCRYSLGQHHFCEQFSFDPGGDWSTPAVDAAARILFLLAGVSYYKAAAPPVVDLGDTATTDLERRFLRTFYTEGLAEFAYRNDIDLSDLRIVGPEIDRREPAPYASEPGRPLVPFGGGIDSIVSAEVVRQRHPGAALFVVSKSADRFDAIERPAKVSGLPVIRAERELDAKVVRSTELGFLNGHVPVTGIISATALVAAVLSHRSAVVMSNEWSASVGNVVVDGRTINHQWSKGMTFELGFREVLAAAFDAPPSYFSLLRPYSELWVASRFADLTRYHPVFRSCNRAFHVDRARRLDRWCGTCDKCCFIDLVLSPFLPRSALVSIFSGHEPLEDPALESRFRALLGTGSDPKPFECVGDVGECRAALLLAAGRTDRAGTKLIQTLATEVHAGSMDVELLHPIGAHCIPDEYAPEDQLV